MRARVVVVAVGRIAIVAWAANLAEAAPRIEASGFVGIDWFGEHTELGNSWAAEQVPGTSSLVGGRVSWLALPALPGALQLAIEAELALAPAFTGGSYNVSGTRDRMSYFAPVFAWRAHALLRLARWREIEPHLVLGGGGETVASTSPFMSKETDPVIYWGPGVRVPFSPSWHVRIDLRHGAMPARDGGMTSTVEIQLGLGTTFGQATAPPAHRAPRVPEPVPEPVIDRAPDRAPDRDRDGDRVVDRIDACPTEAETVNGVADDDGCPEPDPDADGLIGAADQCPDHAEDLDGFEDADGCPDLDNDRDGIDDKLDGCPAEPETENGFDDSDGCPDQLPAEITSVLAIAVPFEPGRARVTVAARGTLRPVLALLLQRPELHLAITGHARRAERDELAKRRAEAVKWHLVDQGIAEDRIATDVTAASASAPPISFALVPAPR